MSREVRLSRRDETLVDLLIETGLSRNIAKTLVSLSKRDETTSVEIDKATGQRQREVRLAMEETRRRKWGDGAGDARDPAREFHGPPDRPEVRIEEVVPVVRSEGLVAILPQFDLRAERLERRARVLPAEWMDLHGQRRPRAEATDELRVIH